MHPQKETPWIFRTYAGHSTAAASNALYRSNLAKGQTGLSVAAAQTIYSVSKQADAYSEMVKKDDAEVQAQI